MTPLPADIQAALDKLEPAIAKAFADAIAQITSTAQLTMIEDAIKRGAYDEAVRLLSVNPSAFAALDNAIMQARYQGAVMALASLPRLKDPFPVGGWSLALMLGMFGQKNGRGGTSEG